MAVTVLPTILVDSATGSDTAASGAGPGTALTGTGASTDVGGTTVTLDAGTDLTNVATDGSHLIYLIDATAGHRRFAAINAKAGSGGATPTVTVEQAFTGSLAGKSWAIGGKRASIGSATSSLLLENNAAAGDAMPGWIAELQSAHSETIAATITLRRGGDTTSGHITIRGASGAATLPKLIFSNNGNSFSLAVNRWRFKDFEVQNSNATKTASVVWNLTSGCDFLQITGMKVADATNKYWKVVSAFANATNNLIEDNYFGNTASHVIDHTGGSYNARVKNNTIFSVGGVGINLSANGAIPLVTDIEGNVFAFCTNQAIVMNYTVASGTGVRIIGNVFHGSGSDGISSTATSAQVGMFSSLQIEDNIFSYNGGFGINFSGSGIGDTLLGALGTRIRNNAFFTNTSGKYQGFTVTSSLSEQTGDPAGGLASATKDYTGVTGGTNFQSTAYKEKGYPGSALSVGTFGSSKSYRDIGLQHQDAGGGSTGGNIIGS